MATTSHCERCFGLLIAARLSLFVRNVAALFMEEHIRCIHAGEKKKRRIIKFVLEPFESKYEFNAPY